MQADQTAEPHATRTMHVGAAVGVPAAAAWTNVLQLPGRAGAASGAGGTGGAELPGPRLPPERAVGLLRELAARVIARSLNTVGADTVRMELDRQADALTAGADAIAYLLEHDPAVPPPCPGCVTVNGAEVFARATEFEFPRGVVVRRVAVPGDSTGGAGGAGGRWRWMVADRARDRALATDGRWVVLPRRSEQTPTFCEQVGWPRDLAIEQALLAAGAFQRYGDTQAPDPDGGGG